MGLNVVVTGASSGIGRATVLRFSKDGHEVFATGRSEAKLAQTVSLAKAAGGAAVYTGVGDVSVEADVLRNYEEAIKALGKIDVAVLNAGTAWALPFEEHTAEIYDKTFNSNVRGTFLWIKALLPAFKKQGSGQIVIINSVGGLKVIPGMTLYSASKFALTGIAEGLRGEVVGTGIKVASVFPGAVDTDIWSSPNWEEGADTRTRFALDLALLPEDVAHAVATIAYQSPRSDIDTLRVLPNYGLKKA